MIENFFLIESILLIVLIFISLWEVSLIKIKKWRYTKIVRKKGYSLSYSLEDMVILLRNLKIFFLILTVFIFIENSSLDSIFNKIVIIILGYAVIFLLFPAFINEKIATLIVEKLLLLQNIVFKLFSYFLLPLKSFSNEEESVDEKISSFIFEGKEKGIINSEDEDMVERLLYFKEKSAREIMTPRISVVSIEENKTIRELKELISLKKKSRIPVFREKIDNIVGVINAKDVFKFWGRDDLKIKDSKELIRDAYFITEYMKIIHLLKAFQEKKTKLALVVDEYGGLSGIVTIEDIVEEIVGEIYDEFEKEKKVIEMEGSEWVIDGEAPIEEVEEALDIEFGETYSAVTIGGLLNFITGKLPEVGDKVRIGNFLFEISSITEKGIKKVKAKRIVEEEGEDEI